MGRGPREYGQEEGGKVGEIRRIKICQVQESNNLSECNHHKSLTWDKININKHKNGERGFRGGDREMAGKSIKKESCCIMYMYALPKITVKLHVLQTCTETKNKQWPSAKCALTSGPCTCCSSAFNYLSQVFLWSMSSLHSYFCPNITSI